MGSSGSCGVGLGGERLSWLSVCLTRCTAGMKLADAAGLCVCCPRGEQEGLASGTIVEPRLRVWHSVCSEGMHLTCC